jgi:hypothetical protein
MIFNNNFVQRSNRIFFEKGFQNSDIVGEWVHLASGATIGKTLHFEAFNGYVDGYYSQTNPRICTGKPIDVTNLNEIRIRIEELTKELPDAFVGIGICSEKTFNSASSPLKRKEVRFSDAANTVTNRLISLDVSDMTGEYYFYIEFSISGSQNSASMDIEKLWIT